MNAELFLGVDGGQSSTEAVIGDVSGEVLGRGTAGPCNHISGEEAVQRFESALLGAIGEACADAGLPCEEIVFRSVCLGLSGGPEDKAEHIRRIVRAHQFAISHDAEIALWGALAGKPGIIVIAGTGSIAYGRNQAGLSARAGGWGYLFGDEGGAWDVAKQAVRAALAMEEGWGAATSLHPRLLAETESASAYDMLHKFYTPAYPRSRVAKLARAVDSAAQDGDVVARRVLEQAGEELGRYALAVHRPLFAPNPSAVSYSGGVFESQTLLAAFQAAITQDGFCRLQKPDRSPAEGALLRAIAVR